MSVIYSYALAGPASSGRPSRPMYVRVEILRRGYLYNKIYLWQIKSPGCHIGGNETPHLVIAQTLEDNLPLSLGDISVQHGCFKFDSGVDLDPVRFLFRVAEDNALWIVFAVHLNYVFEHRDYLVWGTLDCQMFHLQRRLVFVLVVFYKVDYYSKYNFKDIFYETCLHL